MSNDFGGGERSKTLFGAPRPEEIKENKWAKLSDEELLMFRVLLDYANNPLLNTPSEGKKPLVDNIKYPNIKKIGEIIKAHGLTLSDLPSEIYTALVDLEMLSVLEDDPIVAVKEKVQIPSLKEGESLGIISMHDPRPTLMLEGDSRREMFSQMLEEAHKYLSGEKEGTFDEITILCDSIVHLAQSLGMRLKDVLGEDTEFIDFIVTNAKSTGGVGTVDVKNMYPETVLVDRAALESRVKASSGVKKESDEDLDDLLPLTSLQRLAHAVGSFFKPKKKK